MLACILLSFQVYSKMVQYSDLFSVLLLLTAVCHSSSQENTCDDDPYIDEHREQLFKAFQRNLLSNDGNLHRIRNVLFPPLAVLPELARIKYHLNFVRSDNSTKSACSCLKNNSDLVNTTATKPLIIINGWTTIAIYTFIHPAMLNQLQLQLPFMLLRLGTNDQVPFLWDGCNDLPSIIIDLSIPLDNLTCIPTMTDVEKVLEIVTVLLRIDVIPDGANDKKYYALSRTFIEGFCVASYDVCSPSDGNMLETTAIPIAIFSTFFAVAGIASTVGPMTISVLFKGSKHVKIKTIRRLSSHKYFILACGFVITISLFAFADLVCEIIAVVKWRTSNCSWEVHKSILIGLLAFWILAATVVSILFLVYKVCKINNSWQNIRAVHYIIVIVFVFYPAALFIFWLSSIYLAVIFMGFAYPLYVLILVALHAAYIFVFTNAFAVLIAKIFSSKKDDLKHWKILMYITVAICLTLLALLVYGGIVISFGLTVIQGLVTSEGAQAAVGFVPTIALAVIGWLIQQIYFRDSDSYDASPVTKRIIDKIMLYERLSVHDRQIICQKIGIPSQKAQKFEIEASKQTNVAKAALTMIINYWLNEMEGSSLYDLAVVFDEMQIKENENKTLSDRIRRIGLDTTIEMRDIDRIIQVLNFNGKLYSILANEFGINIVERHCCKNTQRKNNDIEMTEPPAVEALVSILDLWVKNKNATWKKLVKTLEKRGKLIEATKVAFLLRTPVKMYSAADLMVLDGNEALTDVHINNALVLLKRQFPRYIVKNHSDDYLNEIKMKGISIISVSNGYWVCYSTMNCPEDTIQLYDSTHAYNDVDQQVCTQINSLLHQPLLNTQIMECQESSRSDSGLYAIANATLLCYSLATENIRGTSEKPTEWHGIENYWRWDKHKMREHLKKCFTKYNLLTPFPTDPTTERAERRSTYHKHACY